MEQEIQVLPASWAWYKLEIMTVTSVSDDPFYLLCCQVPKVSDMLIFCKDNLKFAILEEVWRVVHLSFFSCSKILLLFIGFYLREKGKALRFHCFGSFKWLCYIIMFTCSKFIFNASKGWKRCLVSHYELDLLHTNLKFKQPSQSNRKSFHKRWTWGYCRSML